MATFQEDTVPEEFKLSTSCFCSFWKVRSPLETELGPGDRVLQCMILITKTNNLIEYQKQIIRRVISLEVNNVLQVLVHHEFEPFSRYIILLTEDRVVQLLDYESLKVINSWTGISKIVSRDFSETGRPTLSLEKSTGEKFNITKEEFLTTSSVLNQEKSRAEAVAALNKKLMSLVWLCDSVKNEKIRKERFILQRTSELALQLRSTQNGNINNSKSELDIETTEISVMPSTSSGVTRLPNLDDSSVLKVLNTRQRIIHNKWVICVNLMNDSEKYIVRNPELVLYSTSLKILRYRTRLMKTYQKTPRNPTKRYPPNDVIFEDVEPPIIRPKKKVYLIAICDFPDFSSGKKVSCSGVISFKLRSLKTDDGDTPIDRQILLSTLSLDALNFGTVCADVKREQGSIGLSLDLFVLIAVSVHHRVTVTSFASPLHQFVDRLLGDKNIVKVPDLNNFYCFHTTASAPLHHAAFTYKPITANKLHLTTYTIDDNQSMILLHIIKSCLPGDAFISVENDQPTTFEDSVEKSFISKMNVAISKMKVLESKGEREGRKSEKKAKTTSNTLKSSEESEIKEFSEKEYLKWRQELCQLALEMEGLQAKFNR